MRASAVRLAVVAVVGAASPSTGQIPADVSMGFTFGGGAVLLVAGEVTEHLNEQLAVLGGAYCGSRPGVTSTVGFYGGPRLYTEPAGRFRSFGKLAFGFKRPAWLLAHALTFAPAMGGRDDGSRADSGAGAVKGGERGCSSEW